MTNKFISALEQAWQNFTGKGKTVAKQPQQGQFDNQLDTLWNNTFAQTAYTPQAEQYLRSLPVDYYTAPTNYSPANPPVPYGAQAVYYGGPNGGGIIIDSAALNDPGYNQIEILRHEFNHALDVQANDAEQNASYPQTGYNTANSNNFYSTFQQNAPRRENDVMKNFLNSYRGPNWEPAPPMVAGLESFAQYGARGNGALLSPVGDYYKNIYQPVSQAPLNYSPVYKAPEYVAPGWNKPTAADK